MITEPVPVSPHDYAEAPQITPIRAVSKPHNHLLFRSLYVMCGISDDRVSLLPL